MKKTLPDSAEVLSRCVPEGEFWVFAYGSLMWRPDFPYLEKRLAKLKGYSRALCVKSWFHRGTQEQPGLVFGLDPFNGGMNAECTGYVFRVCSTQRKGVLEALHARELVTDVYQPAMLELLTNQGLVTALTFVVDTDNEQYASDIGLDECARIISRAEGNSGKNIDYVLETWRCLQSVGIKEPELEQLCNRLLSSTG